MSIDFNNQNTILIYSPAFAGGKFLINSLSMSKHCVLTDPKFAKTELSFTSFDENFYNFKLDAILSSLPPLTKINKWRAFEFQEWAVAGIKNNNYGQLSIDEIKNHKFNPLLEEILNRKKDFCFLSHYNKVTLGFQKVWPNCKIITMVNFNKFISIAMPLKKLEHENTEDHLSFLLDHQTTLPFPSMIFDVDHTIFSKSNYLNSIKILYQSLGYTDYREDLLSKYYDEYIYLHL